MRFGAQQLQNSVGYCGDVKDPIWEKWLAFAEEHECMVWGPGLGFRGLGVLGVRGLGV